MVDRCICAEITLGELKRLSERMGGATFEMLRERTGCGAGCGLCEGYVRAMLTTGLTRFPVLDSADAASQVEDGDG